MTMVLGFGGEVGERKWNGLVVEREKVEVILD